MMHIERVLKNPRLMAALTGLSPKEFLALLPTFSHILESRRKGAYYRSPHRQRKPGGGRKGFLKSPMEKLFFVLFYYKCYPTYDVASFLWDCNRANAFRRQCAQSQILQAALKRKLVLPKRQLKSVEEFFQMFPEAKEVFLDGTERPIQRPKDRERQKANYSGKKKRHTRKNLIMSDRKKRIGFLSKTVEGKQHDFSIPKALSLPECIPKLVRQWVDLGFQGYQTQYPEHSISMPVRKPRTKELSPTVKAQNARQSRVRVLVEHAIGGVKRLRIATDVFRNRLKNFDDTAMLIASGLWNYHLTFR